MNNLLAIALIIFSFTITSWSQESGALGSVEATASEWEGVDYNDLGLSQWEFQQAKESGLSRDKLLYLLEIGVRPGEYVQKPWERLNVSEQDWLNERAKGMDDSDIDRSYRYRGRQSQNAATLSLLLPSYYQWKTGKKVEAISMNAIWLTLTGVYVGMRLTEDNNSSVYLIPFILGVHVWSFADGWRETRFNTNPDANRFAWGIVPTRKGAMGAFLFRF